jgi:hypothetical protein
VLAVVLLLAALAAGAPVALALVPLAITATAALAAAWRADVDPRHDGLRGRLILAGLMVLGPLVRGFERARWRVKGLTEVERVRLAEPEQPPVLRWDSGEFLLAYWSENGGDKEDLLRGLVRFLLPRKYFVAQDLGWSTWDLEVHQGLTAKACLRVAVEEHGAGKRLLRVRVAVRPSRAAALVLGVTAVLLVLGAAFGSPVLAAGAGGLALVVGASVVYRAVRLARTLFHALEIVARQVGLVSLRTHA